MRERKRGRWERGRKREGERDLNLLFHLFIHSLVDSCMCPDRGLNRQLWRIGTTFLQTELPSQGLLYPNFKQTHLLSFFKMFNCGKAHIKFIILPFLSTQLSGISYILCCDTKLLKPFSSRKTETLYPLKNSLYPFLSSPDLLSL